MLTSLMALAPKYTILPWLHTLWRSPCCSTWFCIQMLFMQLACSLLLFLLPFAFPCTAVFSKVHILLFLMQWPRQFIILFKYEEFEALDSVPLTCWFRSPLKIDVRGLLWNYISTASDFFSFAFFNFSQLHNITGHSIVSKVPVSLFMDGFAF